MSLISICPECVELVYRSGKIQSVQGSPVIADTKFCADCLKQISRSEYPTWTGTVITLLDIAFIGESIDSIFTANRVIDSKTGEERALNSREQEIAIAVGFSQ